MRCSSPAVARWPSTHRLRSRHPQLLAMKQSATLLGSREDVLRFQGKPGNVTVIDMVNDGGSKVLVSDVPACKSILNVISLPLLPSSVSVAALC